MDAIDRRIVELLLANGRATYEEIARTVHLSRPAIHERVRRLTRDGIVRGYTARVDWALLGMPLLAYVAVQYAGVRWTAVTASLRRLAHSGTMLREAHRVTGDYCLLLKLRAASPLSLQEFLDAVRDIPGVTATRTTLVLSTVIEEDLLEEPVPALRALPAAAMPARRPARGDAAPAATS